MPYGLLDYNIRFVAKGSRQNLGFEEHYALWLMTMFSHFGHKWLCLHRGPAWQYEVEVNTETAVSLLRASHSSAADSVLADSEVAMGAVLLEQIDIILSALQESSLCSNDLDWAGDTLDDINSVSPVLENSASCSEVVRVPHLWTHVSGSQQ